MSANNNSVVKIENYVAKEALKGFMNTRLFSGLVTKDYSADFQERGAKKGDTIFVKKPAQFRVRVGSSMKTQNIKEQKIPVVIGDQQGVDFEFSIREATLDIDHGKSEYSSRFIRPAGSTLASNKDAEGMKIASQGAGYAIVLGAQGQKTDAVYNAEVYKGFTDAKAMLNKFLAPKGVSERYAVVGSDIEGRLAQNVSTLFNAQADITKAIKTAGIENVGVGGLTWGASDLAYVHTNGAGGDSLTISSVSVDYDSPTCEITLSAANNDLAVGDTIEFTGVYFVNAETKGQYAQKLQRKVLGVNGTKVKVYSIYPAAIAGRNSTTITTDNVDTTADANLPANVTRDELRSRLAMANATALPSGAVGSVLGTKGSKYLCCPVFQKKAVVLTSVDLVRPTKCEMSDAVKFDGMVMRFLEDYDIHEDQLPDRIDILASYTILYPEWIVDVEIPL